MDTVIARDGTPIAFDLSGHGEPIIFVAGVFNDHATLAPLAELLRPGHTTVTYDRRGRGHSGDTKPYAIAREVEDLAVLIDRVGGSAAVFAYSSGAVLALRAAADGVPITRLALYEPPFAVGDVETERPAERPAALAELVELGRNGDAVEKFQAEHLHLPAGMIRVLKRSPMWPNLEAMAQSMVYDAVITTEHAVPTEAMTAITTPTLVLSGAKTWPHQRTAAVDLARSMPAARYVEVAGGANHTIPPEEVARAVRDFLGR